MKFTDEGIEDTIQWTIIGIAIGGCALMIFTIGNAINQTLTGIGVL